MTQLERFNATVRHEPHDEFLWSAEFTPDVDRRIRLKHRLSENEDLLAYFKMFQPVYITPKLAAPGPAPNFARYFEDYPKPEKAFINHLGVLEIPAKFYHFKGYVSPLRNATTLRELEQFPYPQPGPFDESGLKELVADAHRQGKVACTWVGHMYEDAWQVRGYEEFLMDTVERPEWCECILDSFARKNLAVATAAARAGVDLLQTGDDVANQVAMMLSVPAWRKLMKSRWAAVYAAARVIKPDIQIFYHSDGNIESIIPELIEIGITILNPLQPECLDVVKLKRLYGRQLVFDGAIGTQTTMPFGTVEDVRRTVREAKRNLGRDGALILSPTHILEPEVPVENIEAFADEAAGRKPEDGASCGRGG
jgi:uroporphyrinogen decarboxylase